MNTMPKFVASRTLDTADWNATILKGEIPASITRLKEQPGQDLLIYGSGELVDELTRHRLIDEYRLMVHPVIVGGGKRLFSGLTSGFPTTNLHLANATTTGTGVAVLTYTTAAQ
jgi:dihydrofolate reductase